MSATNIEWAQRVWNAIKGCSRVNEGCRNCYAERMAYRLAVMSDAQTMRGEPGYEYAEVVRRTSNGTPLPQWNGKTRLDEAALLDPLKRRKPADWFVNSMSDTWHESVPRDWHDRLFAVMAMCPQHRFLDLTKRTERREEYLNGERDLQHLIAEYSRTVGVLPPFHEQSWPWPLPNYWAGASASDQASLDAVLPPLLATPAAHRFLSLEPLLGPVSCGFLLSEHGRRQIGAHSGIDWVIVGGESGPRNKVRPFHEEWAASILDQCRAVGVACFFKQYGSRPMRGGKPIVFQSRKGRVKGSEMSEWPEALRLRQLPWEEPSLNPEP